MKTTEEILLDAVELIKTRGWTQGTYYNEKDGCLCADGAIKVAAGVVTLDNGEFESLDVASDFWDGYDAAYVAACKAAAAIGYVSASIIGYNDADGRTEDEVLAVLRAAAEVSA